MTFSTRSAWRLDPNPLTARLDARNTARSAPLDLTRSNPTELGFGGIDEALARALTAPSIGRYRPDPLGAREAREAVCGYYRDHGVALDPAQIVLTASTSEAYGYLFKLLCDPGDRVSHLTPGYPLFDELARLEGVTLAPCPASLFGRWELAPPPSAHAESRALLLVHPNNPTGHLVRRDEREAMVAWAAEGRRALVVDEVFLDYGGAVPRDASPTFAGESGCLCFTLSGLSKVAALPQLKLGWVVVSGPEPLRREALARLEMIADCYLSVSAPVQAAAATILAQRGPRQRSLCARLDRHDAALRAAFAGSAVSVLPRDAGWYAVLKLPRVMSDEAWALSLVDAGVVTQPGYYFDLPDEAMLVLSLLTEEDEFFKGVARLKAAVEASLGAAT